MNYILVTECSTKALEVSVCNMMERGYKPWGGAYGVQYKRDGSSAICHQHTQAMVFDVEAAAQKKIKEHMSAAVSEQRFQQP